ncbi:ribosome biogenesis GTPase YlqF [Philodulcilactobacillus myokoensis]|uniref:ribosome biogenesis GTPase YlqF n=1 Tax=Philodulcilactobacillus myokoensis TaxID=2929573 RepID=UPI0025705E63|nr:ribosome biogenesis GTPase YlqF [Philodulcilactobacillus myokoensis]
MSSNIQWFPGHMAKALHQFQNNVHLADIIFELVDARCPYSSINPEIRKIGRGKPHLLILTKADLADTEMTQSWVRWFRLHGYAATSVDSKNNLTSNQITKIAQQILKSKINSDHAKGIANKTIRAICVGVPNVGKSTLLNQIIKRRAAQVGNRPGITKGQQWLKSSRNLELLDTPGILWPRFQNESIAYKLALTGAIKDNLYPKDDVALFAIDFFRNHAEQNLAKRYRLTGDDLKLSRVDLLMKITKNAGMLQDFNRGSMRIILDARRGKLGNFTLDELSIAKSGLDNDN